MSNGNKAILREYFFSKTELKELRRLMEVTERRLEQIEKDGLVSDVVRGGMGGTQHFTITGYPVAEHERVLTLLKNRKKRLEMKEKELVELTNKAEEYIESIPKSELRIMFRLFYMEGLTWAQVAMRMNQLFPKKNIPYTEMSCQKRHHRFFEDM